MKIIISDLHRLSSDNPEERLDAINALKKNIRRHPIAALAIAYVARNDPDPAVRKKASAKVKILNWRVEKAHCY
jgi:hypothetical protein